MTDELLGDKVEKVLTKAGITEERVNRVKRAMALKSPCGCKKRKEFLNEVHRAVVRRRQGDK